ncbi:MAG: hypothetical protein AAFW73_17820 [Bacteroidota bacterium]
MHSSLAFDTARFLRILTTGMVLHGSWLFLAVQTDEFTSIDKGLVSGAGFLVIYALSIHLGIRFGGRVLDLLGLLLGLLVIFALSSILVMPIGFLLVERLPWQMEGLPFLLSSIFSGIGITYLVHAIHRIQYRFLTTVGISLMGMAAWLVYEKMPESMIYGIFDYPAYRLRVFFTWQIFTLLPLALGLAWSERH